jgi:poly-gamma-glutamate biosynthesis protein PgsC/CapC
MDLLPLSIGLGLVVSLMFSEIFGLAAGGMVVPGYIALFLTRPLPVALTLAAGLATFGIVRALSSVLIIFGKRRTVLMILVGYLLGALVRSLLTGQVLPPGIGHVDHTVIGYIIPGLIAIWLDRQGVVETFSALLTAAVVVRLLLVLFAGGDLLA